MGAVRTFATVSALLTGVDMAWAGACADPGRDGSPTVGGVVNAYWGGTSNPSSGATEFDLGAASGSNTPITPGDLLLLIQMQDAALNASNTNAYGDGVGGDPASGTSGLRRTGRYEFVRAASPVSLAGGTLRTTQPVTYDYTNANASNPAGQKRFQIIRVPQYQDLSVTGTLTAAPWDGEKGGVVVVDVADTLSFNGGGVDVSGRGFRGGAGRSSTSGSGANTDVRTPTSNGANGSKGEGIAGTPQLVWDGLRLDTGVDGYPNGSFARGAPGNAGGGGTDGRPSANDQNTGGGGGAGAGTGGRGGHAWCPNGPNACSQSGGWGGSGVAQGAARLIMGGGGGAGTTNNATGTPNDGRASSGERGGGIVILRAGTISGAATIRADGMDANVTVDNDGAGGGGGGGAVLIDADDTSGASLSVSVVGGDGGTNGNSAPHGPGGGGGGGFVGFAPGVSLASVTTGGQPGLTDGNPGQFTQNYGATSGANGTSTTVDATTVPGLSEGGECVVEIAKDFEVSQTRTNAVIRLGFDLMNPNPDLPMSDLAFTDTYPGSVVNAAPPDASNTCGGAVSATAGAGTLSLAGGTLAALASCRIEVDVRATASGTYDNVIPPGDATADIGGITVDNLDPAEDTLIVSEPLSASKVVSIIEGTYAIPGSVAEYTISFSNPGPGPAQSIDIRDIIPANTTFLNQSISGAGSVVFDDGNPATGLTLGTVSFSSDGGTTYNYTPSAGADAAVTHLRVVPSGDMASASAGAIRFRVVIR